MKNHPRSSSAFFAAAISRADAEANRYRIAVNAEGIATGASASSGTQDGLRLDTTLTLNAPLRLEDYAEARPRRIEIDRAELDMNALKMAATGEVDVLDSGHSATHSQKRGTWNAGIFVAASAPTARAASAR